MLLRGRLVLKDRTARGSVLIKDGRINQVALQEIPAEKCGDAIDYGDDYIMPGFVDLHTHGSGGFDFMDGTAEDIVGAASSHARHGTTTCLPTTLTCETDLPWRMLSENTTAQPRACPPHSRVRIPTCTFS